MILKKGIATILSSATILTAVSPCAFAEGNNSEEKNTKSMSTTGKVLLGAAGAVGLAATAGIIYYAVKNSHVKVETLEGKPIYEKYKELQKAVVSGKCEKVKNLLNTNKELDINAIYSGRFATLLHKAVWKNDVTMCNLLIDRGADINAKLSENQTVLHEAVSFSQYDMCKLLIDRGADVNVKNYFGFTPLHKILSEYGTSEAKLKIVKLLIENDADVNAKDPYWTPLDYAHYFKHSDDIKNLLIKHGAKRGNELK
ncbi:MAG: ankyrin repeat domain-containing protein [Clostridia bacterium]|nr:ankyrin repeat domain-containing protein [Clostridia bacterium]